MPRHDSLRECRRFVELQLLERTGEIRNLQQQVKHLLLPAQVMDGRKLPAVAYVSDFEYEEYNVKWADEWRKVVEDVKGVRTPVYRLKRRLMLAHRGIMGECPGCPPNAVGAVYVRET